MANWFCKIQGKVYGPYDGADLRRLVAEGRLLPTDTLRDGVDGDWFAAEEMDNLFPEVPGARRREYDDEYDDDFDRPRRRRRVRSGKPSNYYSVFAANFWEGGQWRSILVITFGLQVLIPTIFNLIALLFNVFLMPARGAAAIAGALLLGAIAAFFVLAVAFALDVLMFGLACLIFRIRLNPRRDSVLDVFAFCYLVGMIPTLIRLFTSCASLSVANYMLVLHPFFHLGVLVYLMVAYWGLPASKAWALGSIRFAYQMAIVALFLLAFSNRAWLR